MSKIKFFMNKNNNKLFTTCNKQCCYFSDKPFDPFASILEKKLSGPITKSDLIKDLIKKNNKKLSVESFEQIFGKSIIYLNDDDFKFFPSRCTDAKNFLIWKSRKAREKFKNFLDAGLVVGKIYTRTELQNMSVAKLRVLCQVNITLTREIFGIYGSWPSKKILVEKLSEKFESMA